MGFLSLQTLIDRYMETVGYRVIDLQSVMAGPCANRQLGTLQNETFFAMDGHLTKAGYEGDLKYIGCQVTANGESTNPLVDVPEPYFRIKREFRGNEIRGLSLEADVQTYAITRSLTERHPSWVDVQVTTEGVSSFLASQQHAAASMTGAVIGYSAKKNPTLCEAISVLAFGSAVDRDGIAERLDQSFKKRTALVESVLTEAAADPAFNHFPKNLPLNEEQIILMFFEDRTPTPWPASTQALIELCVKTNRQHQDDDYKMTKAMAFIHEAARMGHLKVYGKATDQKDGAQIPASEFHTILSLNFLYDTLSDLGLDGILNDERWVDVTIDGADFRKWLSTVRHSENSDKPEKDASIWDFAFAKYPHEKTSRERLVAEIYSAFWKGEFAPDGLTLLQGRQGKPGSEAFNGMTRVGLAEVALGQSEFAALGEAEALASLARWNISDYRKIRDHYGYYFCPADDAAGHKRGLCSSGEELEAWFTASPYRNLPLLSNQHDEPSTGNQSTVYVKKGKTAVERLAVLMAGEWPNGLPHNLKAPDRNKRVNELSKEHGGSTFGDRTMVRALELYNSRAK